MVRLIAALLLLCSTQVALAEPDAAVMQCESPRNEESTQPAPLWVIPVVTLGGAGSGLALGGVVGLAAHSCEGLE